MKNFRLENDKPQTEDGDKCQRNCGGDQESKDIMKMESIKEICEHLSLKSSEGERRRLFKLTNNKLYHVSLLLIHQMNLSCIFSVELLAGHACFSKKGLRYFSS